MKELVYPTSRMSESGLPSMSDTRFGFHDAVYSKIGEYGRCNVHAMGITTTPSKWTSDERRALDHAIDKLEQFRAP